MRSFLRSPLLLCLFAPCLALPLCADPSPTTPPPSSAAVPPALAVPSDQTLAFALTARGVQIYVCRPTPGPVPGYQWGLKAPEADLFDAGGRKVGRHYAGPTWEMTDGGKVMANEKARAESPDKKGIPWLLLTVYQSGGDLLGNVRSIRRIDTVGGEKPAEPADRSNALQERRVPYTATYQFFVARP